MNFDTMTDAEVENANIQMKEDRRLALGLRPGRDFTITAEHSALRNEMHKRRYAASQVAFANEKAEKELREKEYIALHGHRSPMQVRGKRDGTSTGFDGESYPSYRTPTNEDNSSGTRLVEGDTYSYTYSGNSGYYTVEHVWRGEAWECTRDDTPWQMR